MNCNEVLELISAELDGELDKEIKPAFYNHLSKCARCKSEFELEQITKIFISKNLNRTFTPSHLRNKIIRQIETETKSYSQKDSILSRIFNLPRWQIVTAMAGSAAVIIFILLTLTTNYNKLNIAPINNNLIHHVYNNFNGIVDQKVIPAIARGNPESAQIYFNRDINFPAFLPPMNNCKFLGAMFSEYANVGTAHLVYKNNDEIIYILEVTLDELKNHRTLSVPDDILVEAKKSKIYFDNRLENYSLAVWLHDSLLCCAITQIDNQKLISYLTNN